MTLRNLAAAEAAWADAQEAHLKTLGIGPTEPIIRLRNLAKAALEATPSLAEKMDAADIKALTDRAEEAEHRAARAEALTEQTLARQRNAIAATHALISVLNGAPPKGIAPPPTPTEPHATRAVTVNGIPAVSTPVAPIALRHGLILKPVGDVDVGRERVIFSETKEGQFVAQTIDWNGVKHDAWTAVVSPWPGDAWTEETYVPAGVVPLPRWDAPPPEEPKRKTGAKRSKEEPAPAAAPTPPVAVARAEVEALVNATMEPSAPKPGGLRRTRLRIKQPLPGMRVEPFEVDIVEEDPVAWMCLVPSVPERQAQRYPKDAWIDVGMPDANLTQLNTQPPGAPIAERYVFTTPSGDVVGSNDPARPPAAALATGRIKICDWHPTEAQLAEFGTKAGASPTLVMLTLQEWQTAKANVEVNDPAAAFVAVLSRKVRT